MSTAKVLRTRVEYLWLMHQAFGIRQFSRSFVPVPAPVYEAYRCRIIAARAPVIPADHNVLVHLARHIVCLPALEALVSGLVEVGCVRVALVIRGPFCLAVYWVASLPGHLAPERKAMTRDFGCRGSQGSHGQAECHDDEKLHRVGSSWCRQLVGSS